jgi:hypothetical protein
MNHRKTKIAGIVLAVAGALAAIGITFAGPAGALPLPSTGPTFGCSHGILAGYCGTQADTAAPARALAAGPFGSVVGTTDNFNGVADFFWLAYDGGPTKVAIWAPHGVPTDLALTCAGGHLVLAPSTGAPDQQWTATAVSGGFTWTNLATGKIMDVGMFFPFQVEMVTPPLTATPSETFNFTG